MIALRTITEDHFSECLRLQASVENKNFVDSVVYSLAEAWLYHENTKPYAIYKNDKVIGFVSMYVGEENYQIINFLIDDFFREKALEQRRQKHVFAFCKTNTTQKEYPYQWKQDISLHKSSGIH